MVACDRIYGGKANTGVLHVVDSVDRGAANRRHRPRDARRLLAGRAALRLLANYRMGRVPVAAARVKVTRKCVRCGGPHGQPVLQDATASTSTSGDRVLVAVGPRSGFLGVDIEEVPGDIFEGFDDFTLHPAESQSPDIGCRIETWVRKEAALKASGTGLNTPPRTIRLSQPRPMSVPDTRQGLLQKWSRVVCSDDHNLGGIAIALLDTAVGYRAAIATTEPISIRFLDIGAIAGR